MTSAAMSNVGILRSAHRQVVQYPCALGDSNAGSSERRAELERVLHSEATWRECTDGLFDACPLWSSSSVSSSSSRSSRFTAARFDATQSARSPRSSRQRQIELKTDELGYNLLNSSLDLKNVRLRSARLPDAPVFATIGRARINLSLVDLLRGKYVVQSGTVEDVNVHYFVDEQGRDNLPRPPTDPNNPNQPLDYLIAALSVSKAHVRYENRAEQIDVELPVSSIDVSGNRLTDRHRITLEAASGRVRVKDRSSSIDRLTGELDLSEDDLKAVRLDVESEGSRAELVDVVYDLTRRRADVASVILRGQWGEVKGSGTVALDASERSQIQADINNVDAEWLMRALKLPVHGRLACGRQGACGVARPRVSQGDRRRRRHAHSHVASSRALDDAARWTTHRARTRTAGSTHSS